MFNSLGDISHMSIKKVHTYPMYLINDFIFNIINHKVMKIRMKIGVCSKGKTYDGASFDYFNIFKNIF